MVGGEGIQGEVLPVLPPKTQAEQEGQELILGSHHQDVSVSA